MTPRDVNYEFRVVGDLPEPALRPSQLEDGVEFVKTKVEHGKATIIADYANRTAAAAAVNVLRKRHGLRDASGLHFQAHKNESGRTDLYVVFHPGWITEEGVARHEQEIVALEAKKAADKVKAKAAKAAAKAAAAEPAKTDGSDKKKSQAA